MRADPSKVRGLAPERDDRWDLWENGLRAVLSAMGMRAIAVPVVPNADSWRGRVETTRGARSVTYSRESGLAIQQEGTDG